MGITQDGGQRTDRALPLHASAALGIGPQLGYWGIRLLKALEQCCHVWAPVVEAGMKRPQEPDASVD